MASNDGNNVVCRYDRLNLPRERREEIGRRTKRLLDVARLDYVKNAFPHLDNVKLAYYCTREVSLENVAMVVSRTKK